jgi:uncharacterized repeat protein (TIGR03803 family)
MSRLCCPATTLVRFTAVVAFTATTIGVSSPGHANGQAITILHNFVAGPNDGKNPQAALTASGNTLYGMCASGANEPGIVFQIGTDGSGFSLLHTFTGGLSDGANPTGSLLLSGASLYGTTIGGGSSSNDGTVFSLNADGTGFGVLHSFTGGNTDGISPHGTLIQSGSTMYGMTGQGGTANLGTIFQVNINGTGFALPHSFAGGANDGHGPSYNMLTQSGTTLFGMTGGGDRPTRAWCSR